jgi:hypothetical protein
MAQSDENSGTQLLLQVSAQHAAYCVRWDISERARKGHSVAGSTR